MYWTAQFRLMKSWLREILRRYKLFERFLRSIYFCNIKVHSLQRNTISFFVFSRAGYMKVSAPLPLRWARKHSILFTGQRCCSLLRRFKSTALLSKTTFLLHTLCIIQSSHKYYVLQSKYRFLSLFCNIGEIYIIHLYFSWYRGLTKRKLFLIRTFFKGSWNPLS